MSGNKIVTVIGSIGAGKSSILRALERLEHLDLNTVPEAIEEWAPYLKAFYSDKARYALALQLVILYTQTREKCSAVALNKLVLTERSPLDSRYVFWAALRDERLVTDFENDLYIETYNRNNWTPDIVIYLKASLSTLVNRISARRQAGDSDIDVTYLNDLTKRYDQFVTSLRSLAPATTVFTIDANQPFDRVLAEVVSIIEPLSKREQTENH